MKEMLPFKNMHLLLTRVNIIHQWVWPKTDLKEAQRIVEAKIEDANLADLEEELVPIRQRLLKDLNQ